ncbi:hypothetical protein EV668_0966 [Enterovirga rhinocerotis]|uniref:PsiF repeat-containing protein n=1 Tax=Enterovirga rhinocerotis TaxID=1339210 RepID=A0A4R7C640_9HYPH|nr:hypothetical protein EV668_0966 [Enterovirga rhinocerotis]
MSLMRLSLAAALAAPTPLGRSDGPALTARQERMRPAMMVRCARSLKGQERSAFVCTCLEG